jgi:hypothetical protein
MINTIRKTKLVIQFLLNVQDVPGRGVEYTARLHGEAGSTIRLCQTEASHNLPQRHSGRYWCFMAHEQAHAKHPPHGGTIGEHSRQRSSRDHINVTQPEPPCYSGSGRSQIFLPLPSPADQRSKVISAYLLTMAEVAELPRTKGRCGVLHAFFFRELRPNRKGSCQSWASRFQHATGGECSDCRCDLLCRQNTTRRKARRQTAFPKRRRHRGAACSAEKICVVG